MNVLIWGFEYNKTSFNNLLSSKSLDIKMWIGEKSICSDCTLEVKDLYNNKFIESLSKLNGVFPSCDIYMSIYNKYLTMFFNMYSRTIDGEYKNFHENLDKFNIFLNYFFDMIVKNKIHLAFFSSMPHFGPDLLIYAICQELNIKTVMLYQSLFPNKFFYSYNIEDFGDFTSIKEVDTDQICIENKFEKDLFYMNYMPKRKSPLRKYISERIRILLGRKRENLNSITALVKFNKTNLFYKNNEKYAKKEVDLEKKFVYFPLHLQPELTTSTLGGIYSDQILAIEQLRKQLPQDYFIYVKENPKQDYKERNNSFYKRLSLLDNVILVENKYNTYQLMKKSEIVAIITGTAGWEAVCGGKPVIVFGKAWYKSLPGVFQFNDNININNILSYTPDLELIQNKFDKLLSKTRNGIVDSAYEVIYKDLNKEKNHRLIESFIINEIKLYKEEIK